MRRPRERCAQVAAQLQGRYTEQERTMIDNAAGTPTGEELYRELAEYARVRYTELAVMYEPVLRVAAAYGALISEVVSILGDSPPRSPQEVVVRDLLADVFDFLLEWQRPLMEGRPNVAFPLGRRAYESLSLMSACMQDEAMVRRWAEGKQISNGDVRKALTKLPMREVEEDMRSLYKFFSEGSHPNRSLVAARYLGDENRFVLGSIGGVQSSSHHLAQHPSPSDVVLVRR